MNKPCASLPGPASPLSRQDNLVAFLHRLLSREKLPSRTECVRLDSLIREMADLDPLLSLCARGSYRALLGQEKEARACYLQALSSKRAGADVLFNYASALFTLGALREAAALCVQVLDKRKEDSDCMNLLVHCACFLGDRSLAETWFLRYESVVGNRHELADWFVNIPEVPLPALVGLDGPDVSARECYNAAVAGGILRCWDAPEEYMAWLSFQ